MRPRSRSLVAIVLVLAACGKKHEDAAANIDSSPAASASPDAAVASLSTPRTTSASIALGNLDSEITDEQARPGDALRQAKLSAALLTRAQFLGRIADLEAADEVTRKCLVAHPDEAKAHFARASVLGSFHRFDLATKEIDAAEAAKASAFEVAQARMPVLLALGKCEQAARGIPSGELLPLDLATKAAVEQRRGHPEEAEKLFGKARDQFRDVSPFALAWMDFERARALERQGDKSHAHDYLLEAVTILPSYAHAAIHLAAMESGPRALEILAAIEGSSDDPDALSAKADALRRAGRTDDAAAAAAKAKTRFDELLSKHPEAFADHAAAFYLGVGKDVPRALDLAKKAATNAPSDEALDEWLTAAQSLGDRDEVCRAATLAASVECVQGPALKTRLEAARANCPR